MAQGGSPPLHRNVVWGPGRSQFRYRIGPCVDWASTAVHAQSQSILCDRSAWKGEIPEESEIPKDRRNVVKSSKKQAGAFDVTGAACASPPPSGSSFALLLLSTLLRRSSTCVVRSPSSNNMRGLTVPSCPPTQLAAQACGPGPLSHPVRVALVVGLCDPPNQ